MVSGGGLDGGCGVWDGGASDLDELAGSGVGVVAGEKGCLGCDYARCKRMRGQANSYNR